MDAIRAIVLVLQLDHINGKRNDNRIENLRLLCPNCHSQTPTFTGRNRKTTHYKPYNYSKYIKHSAKMKLCRKCKEILVDGRTKTCVKCRNTSIIGGKRCPICSKILSTNKSNMCQKCFNTRLNKSRKQQTKIVWPSTEELLSMIHESNRSRVAKKLGVSDTAIRKRIKNYPASPAGLEPATPDLEKRCSESN